MALVITALEQALLLVFKAQPPTPQLSAKLMSDAYSAYAGSAQAGVALPVLYGAEKQAFKAKLLPSMLPQTATALKTATAWSEALTAFWLTGPAPVVFTDGVNTGVVPAVPGAVSMVRVLTGVFANLTNTPQAAAAQIAAALDTATRSILITFAPSGAILGVT